MNYNGLKISILGAVRSGIGAARLAKRIGAVPFVSDFTAAEKLSEQIEILKSEYISFEFGGHTEKVFEADIIVTSPGVPSTAPVLVKAKKLEIPVISELEFASRFCNGKVIAITGTNGKTTTTSLMAHTLNQAGIKCYTAGNIGYAFSEIADKVKEDEFVALEVSSFQLDHIADFKPDFAMILNITPDHLDRYDNDFSKYKAAKGLITKNQSAEDYFIFNADDKKVFEAVEKTKARLTSFSTRGEVENGCYLSNNEFIYCFNGNEETICTTEDSSLRGEHNYANTLAVMIVLKKLNVKNKDIASSIKTFSGVEHRLEFVRELDGIKYINDSKATNVDAVWYALGSFEAPINLILGGTDKGNDYSQILELVKENVKKIYAIGSSAEKVKDFFENFVEVEIKKSLDDCVTTAQNEAEENEIVLLSPACASFDMFKNYEHRGEVFKKLVNDLV